MIPYWSALPTGICIATIVMLVGFGGGVLWMPFLLVVMHAAPDTAIITSLLIQTAGTGSGSIAFIRQKKTDNRLALVMFCIAVPGILFGALLAHYIILSHIEMIIGLISLATALLFVTSNCKYTDEGVERVELKKAFKHLWIPVVMSIATGMLTLNVAEWLVPSMREKMGLKVSNAIATCVLLTCGECIVGMLIHGKLGARPDHGIASWAIPGVIIGGQIGPLLAKQIDERMLKEIFIFFLTLIGIHLVYSSYPI
ncbi:MAG: sulfite exporter TauE/SafE family protein [Dissulfurimicrobium sp.]|uniref:sulfite exporter TauE/SafE family protein n=1 Tax=Dissulfurimicrobium TaxID=1769732 RepID=UPI003C789C53